MECPNGGFRPCEGPGLARISGLLVDSLIMLARRVLCRFCYISATKEPAQPCNLVSGLQSWSASILRPIFCPPRHPPASTPQPPPPSLHPPASTPQPPPPSLHPPASTPQPPPPSLHPPASTPQPPPPSLHPPASTPQPPPPSLHPFVSTRDTTSLV